MLGEDIVNESSVESQSHRATGLGLLNVSTRFASDKILRRVDAVGAGPWNVGARIAGYEIHHEVPFEQ